MKKTSMKNRPNIKILLPWLLVFVIMIFIYSMSNQVASASKQLSSTITEKALLIIEFLMPNADIDEASLHHLIRKNAHFFVYTALGFLLLNAVWKSNLTKRYAIILSFLIGSTYAVTDEFHQSFTPGRGPQFTDVLLDSGGVVFGIVLFLLIFKWLKRKEKI